MIKVKYSKAKFNEEVKNKIVEINKDVKKLVDLFRLILKYKIVLRGRGIEFSDIRKYLPTDDASLIDWKVSARMSTSGKLDKLYVKVYEEEQDLELIIAVDGSSTMDFGTQEKLKREYATLLAGSLAIAGVESGYKVSMIMFNDELLYLPPENSTIQTTRILAELINKENWKGGKNFKEALNFIMKVSQNRAVLVIISDFISAGEDWDELLKSASFKFDGVLGIMVRDLRDTYLPKDVGYLRFQNPIDGSITEVNVDKIKEKFEKLAKEQEEKYKKMFLESNAGFIKFYTSEEYTKQILKWFDLWSYGRL